MAKAAGKFTLAMHLSLDRSESLYRKLTFVPRDTSRVEGDIGIDLLKTPRTMLE